MSTRTWNKGCYLLPLPFSTVTADVRNALRTGDQGTVDTGDGMVTDSVGGGIPETTSRLKNRATCLEKLA